MSAPGDLRRDAQAAHALDGVQDRLAAASEDFWEHMESVGAAFVKAAKSAVRRFTEILEVNKMKARMVELCDQEWNTWNVPKKVTERKAKGKTWVKTYWKDGPKRTVSLKDLGDKKWQSKNPWSAAFISWIVRNAGAGDRFLYAWKHRTYIARAVQNRLDNNDNPFKAYRLNEVVPEPGDIVCKEREGSGATYDNITDGTARDTHSDIVTEVKPGEIVTIGGNVDNAVSKTVVTTDADGHVNQALYFAVIKVGWQPQTAGAEPSKG
jgi:hypothetical protein